MSDLVHQDDGSVTVAGLWTYDWKDRPRPFLHPVRTPAGHVVTRDAPPDHIWHHGLWFTIKYVNEENYWEEEPGEGFGTLHDVGPTVSEGSDGTVTVTSDITWVRPDGETAVIDERRVLTHVPIDDDAYAIDFGISIAPRVDVVLDRTPYTIWGGYGGLTVRGPGDLDAPRLLVPDGTEHQQLLGTPGDWCDLTGTVTADGSGALAGFTMFDHPSNPRYPTPWYCSTKNELYFTEDWTNFVNAAFLWDAPIEVAAGETLAMRHRVAIHDGAWDVARANAIWESWTAS